MRDRVVSADPAGVLLESGRRIDADYLILASGSSHVYPAKPKSELTADALEDFRRTHKELAGAERVLILGAGPVGLELAGEITEVWPDKRVSIVDPAAELLPGYLPEVRAELHRQLDGLGVRLLLGTGLAEMPHTEPGRAGTFTASTTGGETITADIWFRAFGVDLNTDYLADGRLTGRTASGEVPVTETLAVQGHENVYAIGDITALGEDKKAGHAMEHAKVVAANIAARLRGEEPTATYRPMPYPFILLPLGTRGGVGQMPADDGPVAASPEMVAQYKGADLFTARFSEQFGIEK